MRARELQKDSSRRLLNAIEIRTHALSLSVAFARNLLFIGEHARRSSHIYIKVASFNALYRARDDLALPRAVLIHHRDLLGLANLLNDDLFGRLRRDAAIVALGLKRKDDLVI